ncbi:Cytochrome c6 [compost metagenome]
MGLSARPPHLPAAGLGACLLAACLLGGCSGQMADQPSYKSGRIALMPASGSIPLTPNRLWATKIPPGTATASNPIAVTQAVLADGKQLYADNCIFCHGPEGRGDGRVGEVFAPRPANLHLPRLVSASDGHFYEVITNGYSTMPAFYKRLDPEQRWKIVAYVRELQHGGK